MDSTPRTKILLAVAPDTEERLRRVLHGHDLRGAQTCAEAASLLRDEVFGMMVLGIDFDESRMFELLADVRARAAHRAVPVMCVLAWRGRRLSEVAVQGLDHAVKAMMANAFLDLRKFPDDDAGNARMRRIVDYLILIDGDLHGSLE